MPGATGDRVLLGDTVALTAFTNEADRVKTFDDFQRQQLRDFVNGMIELSEMKDPEVPGIDT